MSASRGLKIDQVVKICRLRSSENFASKGEDRMWYSIH